MINAQSSDIRVKLNDKTLNFLKAGTVELTMPLIADGASNEVTITVNHNYGQIPSVIAFITFPSVGAASSDFTRFFGGSLVQAGTVGSGDMPIVFMSEEYVEASSTDILFRWKVSNATGFAQPEVTVSIDYYILQQAAPPAPS